MPQRGWRELFGRLFRGEAWQSAAALLCLLFSAALIVNVGLGGEAMWFWYATLFHQGAKLYGDLHLALQPLYVLETDLWMRLGGRSCLSYEGLAFLHAAVLCAGLLLLLGESGWRDWQKALVLAGSYFVIIHFTAYRFDDFHVVADVCAVYSLVLLLRLARGGRRELLTAACLGVLSGCAVMTRVTDGAALLAANAACLLLVARARRRRLAAVFGVAAVAAFFVILGCTGDTLHDYLANSIFRAADAKGGTGTVLHAPLVALLDNLRQLLHGRKWLLAWVAALVGLGAAMQRWVTRRVGWIVLAQLVAAGVSLALCRPGFRTLLLGGLLIGALSTLFQTLTYLLSLWVLVRWVRSRRGRQAWDAREALVLVPLATLVSSAASQANGTSNSFITMALLLLLLPVVDPLRGRSWARGSALAVLVLLGLSGATYKVRDPYSWNAYVFPPMFTHRVWYDHPLYGPMYVDRDLLQFIEPICAEIGGGAKPAELLSMPFPYPNYFCGIPPWRGYVQTWFDTATPETIATLMQQLKSSPPQWILYERQMKVLRTHEMEYNRGRPIAHRALDELLMQKLADGEWTLVEKRDYLAGDGWLLIRTR